MIFRISRGRIRGGFTITELLLGIVISSMTLGALAALALAVGQEWENSQPKQWQNPSATPTRISAYQSTARLEYLIRNSRYLGWAGVSSNNSGSAVFLWMGDYNGNGTMQLGEIALLEFDKAAGTLTKYQLPSTAANASNNKGYDKIDGEADIAAFKGESGMLASGRILQRNVVRFVPSVRNLSEVSMRPTVEYVLEVKAGSRNRCEYRAVALRSPSSQP